MEEEVVAAAVVDEEAVAVEAEVDEEITTRSLTSFPNSLRNHSLMFAPTLVQPQWTAVSQSSSGSSAYRHP